MPRRKIDEQEALDALSKSASATRTRNAARVSSTPKKAKPIARKSVVMSVSLSPDDAEFIRAAAFSHGMPVSVYVRFACREYERSHGTVYTQ